MTYASILTEKQWCLRYCPPPEYGCKTDDVIRCKHGVIRRAVFSGYLMTYVWRRMNPIFNPIKYSRAVKVLGGESK